MTDLALDPGTVIFGYEIASVLGAGGFGITYKAVNPKIEKTVAIKEFFPRDFVTRIGRRVTLRSGTSPDDYEVVLKSFIAEARKLTTAKLYHPNIVRGETFLEENNTAYLVMEFVEGVSLEQWLRDRPSPPSEADLRSLFEKILPAVEHLHDNGSMHRDLTPKNIMVRSDGQPVLIDFGLAGDGLDEDRHTEINAANMFYAPPEQVAGGRQGRYTDIYSLGGVLYRAVTGKPPLVAWTSAYRTALEAAKQRSLYSEAFLAGIDAALKPEPLERPQSIAAFRKALGWEKTTTAEGGERADKPPPGETAGKSPSAETPVPLTAKAPKKRRFVGAMVGLAAAGFVAAYLGVGAVRSAVDSAVAGIAPAMQPVQAVVRGMWLDWFPPDVDWTEVRTAATLTGARLPPPAGAADEAKCRAACAREERCVAFTASPGCTMLSAVDGAEPAPSTTPWALRQPLAPKAAEILTAVRRSATRAPDFKRLEGFVLLGNQPRTTPAATFEACAFRCRTDEACRGITFDAGAKLCTSLGKITARQAAPGKASAIDDADGRTMAALEADEAADALARGRSIREFPGVALTGQEIGRELGLDGPACQARCLRDKSCQGYTMRGGECLRLSRIEGVRPDRDARAVIDAALPNLRSLEIDITISRKGPATSLGAFELRGNAITDARSPRPGSVASAAECERICATAEGCIGFVEHAESKTCTLYSSVTRFLPDPNRTSSVFLSAGDQLPPMTTRLDAIDRRAKLFRDLPQACSLTGSSFRIALGSDPTREQCAFACAAEDRCDGWVFGSSDRICLLMTDVRGATAARDFVAAVSDPRGQRVASLAPACAPPAPAPPPQSALPIAATDCDRLASHASDPDKPAAVKGVAFDQIDTAEAIAACTTAVEKSPEIARFRVYLARALERDGREVEARAAYGEAIRAGSVTAMHQLALMLLQGQGGPRDEPEAFRLLRQAAAAGYTPAMTGLANLLLTPSSLAFSPDPSEALRLLMDAAQKQNPLAAIRLGEIHQDGVFMPPDAARAAAYFRQAAQAYQQEARDGNPIAMLQLARLHDTGRGVTRDGSRAVDFLIDAYRNRSRAARAVLEGTLTDWSIETRQALQQRLSQSGYYFGPIDGLFGRESRDALAAFISAER